MIPVYYVLGERLPGPPPAVGRPAAGSGDGEAPNGVVEPVEHGELSPA